MPVHGASHHHVVADRFVEQDVLFEWAENDEESPVTKARMSEAAWRPKLRVLSEESAGGFHGVKVAFRHVPARVLTAYHSNCRSTSAMKLSDLRTLMTQGISCVPAPARGYRRSPLPQAGSRICQPPPATKLPIPV